MTTTTRPGLRGLIDQLCEEHRRDPHLQALGLEPGCSPADVQAAYRRLARECHPDAGGDADRFRQVREAYEALR